MFINSETYFLVMIYGLEAIRISGILFLCCLIFPVCFLLGMCLSSLFIRISLPLFGEQITLKVLAVLWEIASRFYNGHEIRGIDNVPEKESAIIVYFHGSLPLDIQYVIAKFIIHKNRKISVLTDKFLFCIPFIRSLLNLFGAIAAGNDPSVMEECMERLMDCETSQLLAIAPGGVREAQFGSPDNYEIIWSQRRGYARLAIEADCPLLILFTSNCREVARSPCGLRTSRLLRWIYEKTRLPVIPLFGLFPVKLISHISDPIYPKEYDHDELKLDAAVRAKLRWMVSRHQKRIPGSILGSIIDRMNFH
ncbi:hypothetical protein ACOME3_003882 [Neoechinorhynchus agilis]